MNELRFSHHSTAMLGSSVTALPPFIPSDHIPRVYRQQGWVSPVLLVDGRAAGIWSHEHRGGAIQVEVEPFQALRPKVRKALLGEVERLAAFLGGSPELSLAA